jgi:hypothetical protein
MLTPLAHGTRANQGGCYNLDRFFYTSESGGMVDTLDLGSSALGRAGSSPASRTTSVAAAQIGLVEKSWVHGG